MKCNNCGADLRENAKFCPKCGSKVEAVPQQNGDGHPHDISAVWPEWKIEKQLGRGSYGVVYQAVRNDNNVESHAAIKVISIPTDSSEVDSLRSEGMDMDGTRAYFKGVVDEFVGEIQLMESLKGIQNIVSVEDYKVVEKQGVIGWDIYIRMELLTPFNTYICDKTLTEREVIKLGTDICSALEICNKRNIIHRDIKPENIFINDFGHFKLGDFGIARELENATGGLSQKGTFNYMAPEVANSGKYDARVDTYSLGIVLYRFLNNNKLPFLEQGKQIITPNERKSAVERRIHGEALPAPCKASPAMADLILRACAFDPNDRFSSAEEMKKALMSVADGSYVIANRNTDATVKMRGAQSEYDRTTSVRKAPDEYNVTTSVRKAPQTEQKADVESFGGKKNKKNKNKDNGKSKKGKKAKAIAITVLVLIVALAVALAVLFFRSAAFSVYSSLNSEKFEDAIADYNDDVKDNFIQELLFDMLMKDRVNNVVSEYNNGKSDYKTAIAELDALSMMELEGAEEQRNNIMEAYANDTVTKFNDGKLSYEEADKILNGIKADGYKAADTLLSDIKSVNDAASAVEKADEYYKDGKYEEAISEYSKVPESDENYKKAQEQLDKVYKDYIASVVEGAKKYNNNNEYKQAVTYVNAAYDILPEDVDTSDLDSVKAESLTAYKTEVSNDVAELTADSKWSEAFDLCDEAIAFEDDEYFHSLKTSTEDAYVKSVTQTVDKNLTNFEYTKALNAVEAAIKLLPENKALKDLKKKVEDNTPVYLKDVFIIDSYQYGYKSEPFTDSYGNVYDGSYWFTLCDNNPFVVYNLDQQYTTFNCSIVASTTTSTKCNFSVSIYIDGKLAYSLNDFEKTSPKENVSIDVTNVTKLEFKVSSNHDWYGGEEIALVNAVLTDN